MSHFKFLLSKEQDSPAQMRRIHSRIAWLASALILCLGFLATSIWYLNYVRKTIREDSKGNLAEMGKHIAESLNSDINNTNEVLGALSLELARNDFSEDKLILFLAEQSAYWNFHDLAAIDSSGFSLHQDGSRDTPVNRRLLSEALQSGSMTYDFLMAEGEDCVIFYYPLTPDAQEHSGYLALSGTYAVHNWNLLMDIDIFDGQAVTQILTKNGVVVTRGLKAERAYYNYLDSLSGADFESGITLDQIRQGLKNEQCLDLSYRLNGTEYYLICTPIGFNSWSLAFTVPSSIVNNSGEQMARSVLLISTGLTLIFLLLLFLFRLSQSRSRKRIWDAAYTDDITGGANKNKFEIDALNLLERSGRSYTLAYTNIDQFKLLNQRFGKSEADRILCSVYAALLRIITEHECCARLSADHFVLLMEGNGIEKRLADLAEEQKVQNTASGSACAVRLTFGLCPVESGTRELTEIIDRANMAMKMSPLTENGIAVYTSVMMEQAAREKELTECLQQKSIQKEFTIFLQPKVDLATGLVVGAEALARWISPKFGVVPPGEFIPLAEKAGVICQIDWNTFERVCQTLKNWQDEGFGLIPISFNLSKAQLAVPNFLEQYRRLIRIYQIPCEYLDFEFTESLLYENNGVLKSAVNEIHRMGAQCSVDDFGFGYSSLGLLGQFEADTLKLDRSFFLENACPDSRNNRIVRSVIQIAENLGMHTVAEGIEDQAYVDMLRQFGCSSIQGFFYSAPLPLKKFEEYTESRKERT